MREEEKGKKYINLSNKESCDDVGSERLDLKFPGFSRMIQCNINIPSDESDGKDGVMMMMRWWYTYYDDVFVCQEKWSLLDHLFVTL